jgi:hypothetical protein
MATSSMRLLKPGVISAVRVAPTKLEGTLRAASWLLSQIEALPHTIPDKQTEAHESEELGGEA